VEYGLALPQAHGYDVWHDVTTLAQEAEKAGYASLWAYERVLFPLEPNDGMNGIPGLPWIEFYQQCADPLAVLALAAAVTSEVRLGTSVLVAPLRPALHLARAFATLDQLSRGRVVAGLGSGWSSDEYRAMGADFAGRGKALEETIDACRAFWGADPVSYNDSRTTVANALVNPKPVDRVPVLLGGGRTNRAVDRIGRKADGWIPTALPPAAVTDTWRRIRDVAAEHGRDPEALRLVPRAGVFLSPTPAPAGRRPFQGSRDQVLEDIAAMADVGAHEIILDLFPSARNGEELLDRALEMREATAAAGL
jgi:probable F420-dependent oxidoreductase